MTGLWESFALSQTIFVLALMGFAIWKRGWLRILLSICILIWGVFAMGYDIKIAAPLVTIGTVLFIEEIMAQIRRSREGT